MEHEHKNRTKLFLSVFMMLGLLTLASFLVANSTLMENQVMGWSVMMGISVAKALLVIMFFMHLKWETNWKFVMTIPAAVMSFVLVFMLIPDIAMRTHSYSNMRLQYAPESTVHDDSHHEEDHSIDNKEKTHK